MKAHVWVRAGLSSLDMPGWRCSCCGRCAISDEVPDQSADGLRTSIVKRGQSGSTALNPDCDLELVRQVMES